MLAVGDVSACFRNSPWAIQDKVVTAIRDVANPSLIRIDHVVAFGFACGPGNAGAVMDAILDILEATGIPARKWVDDYMFQNAPWDGLAQRGHPLFPLTGNTLTFTQRSDITITVHSTLAESRAAIPQLHSADAPIPAGYTALLFSYAYTLDNVIDITGQLDVPWAPKKWQGFSFEVEFLGFTWDCWHKRVYVPDGKRQKYLGRIDALLAADRVTLRALEKVYGCIMHVTFVVRLGRSRLPSIQRAMQGFDSVRWSQRKLTGAARKDLEWWRSTLAVPGAFRTLVNRGPPVERGISVDASKDFGIGLRIEDKYKAWRWKPNALGQGGRDIGGAEAIALEFALRYLIAMGIRDELTRVLGDNTSTIGAYDRGRGRNIWTNMAVQRTWELQDKTNCEMHVEYVRSADNPADPVSRGDFSGLTRLPCMFAIPDDLTPFLVEV